LKTIKYDKDKSSHERLKRVLKDHINGQIA